MVTIRDGVIHTGITHIGDIPVGIIRTGAVEAVIIPTGPTGLIGQDNGLDSEAEDNNVEVYISFLRKKLSFLASQVSIGTVRKVGYFLTTSDEPGSFGGGGMP